MSGEPSLASVPPPGYFIRKELAARAWTERDLAFRLGIHERAVHRIVAGKRGIRGEMAKALGDVFGVHPEFFANLQAAYDRTRAP